MKTINSHERIEAYIPDPFIFSHPGRSFWDDPWKAIAQSKSPKGEWSPCGIQGGFPETPVVLL